MSEGDRCPTCRWLGKLPRVTIQMPVYLEGFEFVIKPSIHSLQAAIAAYTAEGGEASLFVNDDGLQLLSEEERYVSHKLSALTLLLTLELHHCFFAISAQNARYMHPAF